MRDFTETVDILFFLDRKRYAGRSWMHVPRKGDEIMLGPTEPKKAFLVTRVVWGTEGPDEDRMKRQAVNIEIEAIE